MRTNSRRIYDVQFIATRTPIILPEVQATNTASCIDGERFADLLKDRRLGVKTEMIEKVDVDEQWFDGIGSVRNDPTGFARLEGELVTSITASQIRAEERMRGLETLWPALLGLEYVYELGELPQIKLCQSTFLVDVDLEPKELAGQAHGPLEAFRFTPCLTSLPRRCHEMLMHQQRGLSFFRETPGFRIRRQAFEGASCRVHDGILASEQLEFFRRSGLEKPGPAFKSSLPVNGRQADIFELDDVKLEDSAEDLPAVVLGTPSVSDA